MVAQSAAASETHTRSHGLAQALSRHMNFGIHCPLVLFSPFYFSSSRRNTQLSVSNGQPEHWLCVGFSFQTDLERMGSCAFFPLQTDPELFAINQ